MEAIRNVALLAHVDAGKTTLTERLLFHTGAIRKLGSVEEGTTRSDTLEVERRRGISVMTTLTPFEYKGVRFNLFDTPGHADFAAQVEKSLWALEGAVLLVSAPDGVEPYTVQLSEVLERCHIPYLVFINQCDRPTADADKTFLDVAQSLRVRAFRLPPGNEVGDEWAETLCEEDEATTERYLSQGFLTREQAARATRAQMGYCLVPVLSGSAATGEGVGALLDAMLELLPAPAGDPGGEVSGRVFGLVQDRALGCGAHVKLYSGTLRVRDAVELPGRTCRILQIRSLTPQGWKDTGTLEAGDVGAVYGLSDCRVGDNVGSENCLPRGMGLGILRRPLARAEVIPASEEDMPALREAMERLSAEDPLLEVTWSPRLRTLEAGIMGSIQLEILESLLSQRFSLSVTFGKPHVVYKETPAGRGEGVCIYTMPKPCWAKLWAVVTPLPTGSGVEFVCSASPKRLPYRYRGQIEQTLPRALRQGRLGWEVTDIRIEIVDGEDHPIHTHPRDFIVATPWVVADALRDAGSRLLEPMLAAVVSVPEALGGRLMHELQEMRGTYTTTRAQGGFLRVEARLPAATSLDFPIRLASFTSGKGRYWAKPDGYELCPCRETAPRRGVDPLDTARYILAMRNAVDAGEEDW